MAVGFEVHQAMRGLPCGGLCMTLPLGGNRRSAPWVQCGGGMQVVASCKTLLKGGYRMVLKRIL